MKKAICVAFFLSILVCWLCGCTLDNEVDKNNPSRSEVETTDTAVQDDGGSDNQDGAIIALTPEMESWIEDTAEERRVLEAVVEFDNNREFDIAEWASQLEAAKVGFTQSEILEIIATEGCNSNQFFKNGSAFWKTFKKMPYSMRFCDCLSTELMKNFSEKMDAILTMAEISEEEWTEFKALAVEFFAEEDKLWTTYKNTTGRAESGYGQRCNEAIRDYLEFKEEVESDTEKSEEEKKSEIDAAYEKYRRYKAKEEEECETKIANALAELKKSAFEAYFKVQQHSAYPKMLAVWDSELWSEIETIIH